MSGVDPLPQVSEAERLRRWRLVLGGAADEPGAEREGAPGRDGGAPRLDARDRRIDAALGALYDRPEPDGRRGGARTGGLGRSRPGIVRWLGEIRRSFPTPVVQMMQRDAVDRLDLQQLLLEPELLGTVEPDVQLVTMLVELNRVLPEETRAVARRVIAGVLADLERQLTDRTRRAVRGALARATRSVTASVRRSRAGRDRRRAPPSSRGSSPDPEPSSCTTWRCSTSSIAGCPRSARRPSTTSWPCSGARSASSSPPSDASS